MGRNTGFGGNWPLLLWCWDREKKGEKGWGACLSLEMLSHGPQSSGLSSLVILMAYSAVPSGSQATNCSSTIWSGFSHHCNTCGLWENKELGDRLVTPWGGCCGWGF